MLPHKVLLHRLVCALRGARQGIVQQLHDVGETIAENAALVPWYVREASFTDGEWGQVMAGDGRSFRCGASDERMWQKQQLRWFRALLEVQMQEGVTRSSGGR